MIEEEKKEDEAQKIAEENQIAEFESQMKALFDSGEAEQNRLKALQAKSEADAAAKLAASQAKIQELEEQRTRQISLLSSEK